jgi:hypothetical protein
MGVVVDTSRNRSDPKGSVGVVDSNREPNQVAVEIDRNANRISQLTAQLVVAVLTLLLEKSNRIKWLGD